jgi:hypothetical protein
MRTQSIDTSPEAERFLVALLRQRGVAKRFHLAASMSSSYKVAALLARHHEQPGLTEQEIMFASAERLLGHSCVVKLRQIAEQRQMLPTFSEVDLSAAFIPVVQAFENMGISCALTGTLARSLYGMQRALFQVDVLADLDIVDATVLQELLPTAFYARSTDIQIALAEKTSFIYYHLPSLFSIRVSFPRVNLNESTMLTRIRHLTLIEGEPALPVLAPEDITILALEEIQREVAELRQQGRKEKPDDLWNELLGVLKIQGPDLDLQLIEQQAYSFGLLSSIQLAFEDAGLRE